MIRKKNSNKTLWAYSIKVNNYNNGIYIKNKKKLSLSMSSYYYFHSLTSFFGVHDVVGVVILTKYTKKPDIKYFSYTA
jgi:hypothetical protein